MILILDGEELMGAKQNRIVNPKRRPMDADAFQQPLRDAATDFH